MDYITVYWEIAVLTLVYTTVLFVNVRSEMGNDWEVKIFRAFLLTLILAVIADAITQTQYRGFLHLPPMLVAFLYGFYMFMFSGVLPFLWFLFVEMRLGTGLVRSRAALAISIIPLAIISFMSFASMKTGWFYDIDEYGIYTRGRYWSFQVVITYCYFMFTTIHAMIVAKGENSSLQKRQYYVLATFVAAPLIGGLLQLYIGNHPFVAPSVSIAMLFIFINIQGNLIHNDSLTGLYNRKSAEGYIEEMKPMASRETPFHIYKMGIEGFKEINDSHGYTEGDKALKTVAKVLQKVTAKYGGMVARLGGVEFLVVTDVKSKKSTDDFREAVENAMEREVKKQKLPYDLKLEFGHALCDSPNDRTATLINEADREMHQNRAS